MNPTAASINRDGLHLHNTASGVRTRVEYLPDGTFLIHTAQEVDDILDHAARLRQVEADTRGRRMRHIAQWPVAVYQRLLRELGRPEENPEGWARVMNDHSKLRVWAGRIGRKDFAR